MLKQINKFNEHKLKSMQMTLKRYKKEKEKERQEQTKKEKVVQFTQLLHTLPTFSTSNPADNQKNK